MTKKNIFTGILMSMLTYFIVKAPGSTVLDETSYLILKYALLIIGLYMLVWLRKN
ncbi:hypothetical protein SAMN04487985_1101 [Aerococcus urinaehominis]|uniref:hypothetical protein n=1 Tax=Aerococcus urinaehominis TaxID=128944 RepID=UPI000881DEF5|nr:hypothetical protein [Aerococcus urinaehominis]SDM25431.1 hypothetical protein SAMN04487985_1101 [Aerococcus urinaehominis]